MSFIKDLLMGVMHCRGGDETGEQYGETARAKPKEPAAGGTGGAIPKIESLDTENLVVLRDLESGTYVLYGRFTPFAGSDSVMTFSSSLLVNVLKRTDATHVQVFYPLNNCVQHLAITDTDYTRTDVYLNDLQAAAAAT